MVDHKLENRSWIVQLICILDTDLEEARILMILRLAMEVAHAALEEIGAVHFDGVGCRLRFCPFYVSKARKVDGQG